MLHPVAKVADVQECVRFVLAPEFLGLSIPWPRSQDLPERCFAVPQRDDLVVCISHAWPYAAHPDPSGDKAGPIARLLAEVHGIHNPQGRVLVFCDFLSVPQRPFAAHQADRTPDEEDHFVRALRAFPQIYLQADVVLHIDTPPTEVFRDGEAYHVPLQELLHVELQEFASEVYVAGWKDEGESCTGVVGFLDAVVSVEGTRVHSIAELEQACAKRPQRPFVDSWLEDWLGDVTCCATERGMAKILKRPFGRRNVLTADERGWVFLERFISMVKAAMVTESSAGSVSLATSERLRAFLMDGSLRLREAVKMGHDGLQETLEEFEAMLAKKQFARVCADQATNQAAFVAVASALDETSSAAPGLHNHGVDKGRPSVRGVPDRQIIAGQMHKLAAHLLANWQKEQAAQRQRQLLLAITRGDTPLCRDLLEARADPNAADEHGLTVLHYASKVRNLPAVRMLIEFNADLMRTDKQGNLPAHGLALWSEDVTLELFKALAPTLKILKSPNQANVKPFHRFDAWARTANGGGAFQPALDYARQLAEQYPELEEAISACATNMSKMSHEAAAVVTARAGLLETVETHHVAGQTFKVHMWQAKEEKECQIDVLYTGMPIYLPWSMQLDGLRLVAKAICKEHRARLVALGHDAFFGASIVADAGVKEMNGVVAKIVEALPLREKFYLLDGSTGFLSPLLWNQRERLLGAVMLNPAGWFKEDFTTTPAFDNFVKRVQGTVNNFRNRQIDEIMKATSNFVFTAFSDDLAGVAEHYGEALKGESDAFWEFYGGISLQHLTTRTELWREQATWPTCRVPVVIACGSHSPVVQVQESALRVKDILPNAITTWVTNSKHWWQVEGELQADCVAQMLIGLFLHRDDLEALALWVAEAN